MLNINTLDELFLLVVESVDILDELAQYEVIQSFAYRLEELYGITRPELRTALYRIGYALHEFCVGCNRSIDCLDATGQPICEECKQDIDSVG
jgi:hypothetical protein